MHEHLILASTASQAASRVLGVVEVVAGFAAILFIVFFVAGRATGRLQRPLAIIICVVPAVLLATVGLVIPAISTFITSLKNQQFLGQKGTKFIGLKNYSYAFSDPYTRSSIYHTIAWLILVPLLAVAVGLTMALLLDRMKRSNFPKTLIFLPTAISGVGASIIFNYIYSTQTPPNPQTGLLSAIVIKLGWKHPPTWLTSTPLNVYLEILIYVWIQAGFAMVVLGAALKAIPDEIIEAARMDGANGPTLFRTVQIPMIRSTIIVVVTTVMIATLKLYDIVQTLNNGDYGTDVLAHQMISDMFVTNQVSRGSALAVILFLCVTPLVIFNIRIMRKERVR